MPLKTQQDEQPSINLTPMIDIVFLLIIFFMVGTKFTEMERKIELSVPTVGDPGALAAVPEKRVINVYQDGSLELDKENVSLEELTTQLANAQNQYQDLGVIVRGDGEAAYKNIASVLAACRKAGITDFGVAVKIGDTIQR